MPNWNTQRYVTPRQQQVQRPAYGGIAGSMAQRGATPYQSPGVVAPPVAPAWTGGTVVGSRSRTPYSTEQSLANGQVPGTPTPGPGMGSARPPAHPGVAPIAQTMAARNVPVGSAGIVGNTPTAQGGTNLQNFRIDPAKAPNMDPGFAQNFNFLMDKYGPAHAYDFAMRQTYNDNGMALRGAMQSSGIDPTDISRVVNQTNQQGNYFDFLKFGYQKPGGVSPGGGRSNEYDRNTNTYTVGGKYGAGGLQGGTAITLPAQMKTY